MDKKLLSETVFFLRDLSVEDEYRIVNSRVEKDPGLHIVSENRKHVQQTSGNVFYKASKELYDHAELRHRPLDRDGDNRLNAILAALCFADPLRNFVEKMASKIDDRVAEVPTAARLLAVIDYFRSRDDASFPAQQWARLDVRISEHFRSVFYLFDELLKLLHDDLLRRYKFTEDVWEDSRSGAKAKAKGLYADFSPVVDIFHLKVRRAVDRNSLARIECLSALEVDCGATSIAEHLRQFDGHGGDAEKSRCAVIRHPHVLTLKLLGAESLRLPEEVVLAGKKYALRSLVASPEEDEFLACVRDCGGFTCLGETVSRSEARDVRGPLLAFYVAVTYDFE